MSTVDDLVVVGAGAAGLVAARTAAGLGASVTLVDAAAPGGDCLWTGCVPSKALLASARRAHEMRHADRVGLAPVDPPVDFAAVMGAVKTAIAAVAPADSPHALQAAGVRVLRGRARFRGPHTLQVTAPGDREITDGEITDGEITEGESPEGAVWELGFRRAVIATGASPVVPPIPGLAPRCLTSDTVWDLETLPTRLVVVGAGAVGCELAQAFARLGSTVTLLEAAGQILPAEDPAAAAAITAVLRGEGVDVRPATTVAEAHPGDQGWSVWLQAVGRDQPAELVAADEVLVAAGRRPDTGGLGLEAVGVQLGDRGHVAVDDRLRSSNPAVFAAGDVTGGLALTHVAGVQGSIAATNAVLGPIRRFRAGAVPWVTFTDPELARVGLTQAQARARHGPRVRTRRVPHDEVDRALIEGDTAGFTEVVLDRRGRVLGASILAPRAGEMLAELTALVARGAPLRTLAGIIHPYPGWSDGPWKAAIAEITAAASRPLARAALRAALTVRRGLPAARLAPAPATPVGAERAGSPSAVEPTR